MEPPDTEEKHRSQGLLHRWFVQYNPLYLISATLCIAGLRMMARGLAEQGSVFGDLAIGAITETYAIALIAGAALLTRLGQRRPAVMLALLTVLYQGDLALHTEGCTYLGAAGIAGSVAWVAVFVAKLHGLAWAMKLRPSRSALGLMIYGGIGLAVIPQVISRSSPEHGSALVAIWLWSVAAFGLSVSRRVQSTVALDDWGCTVLSRSLRGTWLLWALMLLLHVKFWTMTLAVDPAVLIPVAPLVSTRWARREAHVWLIVAATLGGVALAAPALFSLTALLSAPTLALWAYRRRAETSTLTPPRANLASPFRGDASDVEPGDPVATPSWVLAPAGSSAQGRLIVGALVATYLALWSTQWSGGPWPAHVAWLDVGFSAAILVVFAVRRVRISLVPLAICYFHLLVEAELITAPTTTLEWGMALTGGAFILLLGSLAVSYGLRDREGSGVWRRKRRA